MIEFGKTLREAREARGITVSQLAEITHMMPSAITDLENENFSRIAAPIYGRGFVKLYCEAVGLDAAPLIAEFMDIFNGNRDLKIRERPVREEVRAPEPPPQEQPVPKATPSEDDLFAPRAPEPPPAPKPNFAAPRASEPQEEKPLFDVLADPIEEKPAVRSRYAAPLRMKLESSLPPFLGRWLVLAVSAVVLLAVLFFGLRALFLATHNEKIVAEEETTLTPAATVAPADQPAPAKAPVKRTPQKIPPLYID